MRPRIRMLSLISWRLDAPFSGTVRCWLQCIICSVALVGCGGQAQSTPEAISSGGAGGMNNSAEPSKEDAGELDGASIAGNDEVDSAFAGGARGPSTGRGNNSQSGAMGDEGSDSDDESVGNSQSAEMSPTGDDADAGPASDSGADSASAEDHVDAAAWMQVDSIPEWGEAGVPERFEEWFEFQSASYREDGCGLVLLSSRYAGEGLSVGCEKSSSAAHLCYCGYWYPGGEGFYMEGEPFAGEHLEPCVEAVEECAILWFE